AEDAAILSLANSDDDALAAKKMGIDARDLNTARTAINQTQGDVIVMFGSELSAAAQAIVAQFPYLFAAEGRRVLLHPLALFNNSVGAHDMAQGEARSANDLLSSSGQSIGAMYIAGRLLPVHL